MRNVIKCFSKDWTFEDQMDALNCTIFAHDQTVNYPSHRGNGISFTKVGIGSSNRGNVRTLKHHLATNEHENSTIFYLKVDIEGEELNSLPEWVSSGALNHVKQMALEFHLGPIHSQRRFNWLLELMSQLYKLNFRLISHEINMTVGKAANDNYYSYMEVVFMKDDVWNFLDT